MLLSWTVGVLDEIRIVPSDFTPLQPEHNMASSLDLDQVLYARAGWRKAILIPLWIFQVTVLLGLMGIFAYRLAETFEHYEEHDKLGEMPIVEVVYVASRLACPRFPGELLLT